MALTILVLAMDEAARRAGLRLGMPATEVQALVAGLIVRDAEPAADAGALDRPALWPLQCIRADRRRRSAGRAGDRGDRLSPLSPSADSRMFYDILKGMSGARRFGPVGDSSTLESRTLLYSGGGGQALSD